MNKKVIAVILAAATGAFALSGCTSQTSLTGKNADGKTYNLKYNENNMLTVAGEDQDMKDESIVSNTEAGIAFRTPSEWGTLTDQNSLYIQDIGSLGLELIYVPSEDIAKLDTITDDTSDDEADEIFSEAYANAAVFALMYRTNPKDSDYTVDETMLENLNLSIDELYSADDDTYKLAYLTKATSDSYTDLDLKEINMIMDSIPELENNMILFPPVEPVTDFNVDMTSFTAADLDGSKVTEDIFRNYDVTMINVYTTWCPYCIEEMPYIEKMYQGLDKNVNVIGICMDAEDEPETAREEIDETGITYTIIAANEELQQKLENNITGYPTTFFVNSRGEIIGTVKVGTPGSEEQAVIDGYTSLINEALGK